MTNILYIIRVTDITTRNVHASIYANSIEELQTKIDEWKISENGKTYGNQTITAYKYENDIQVSKRILQK